MSTLETGHRAPAAAVEQAFRIERHGIDLIPLQKRWASPRAVGAMWAGASLQVENFIYGAVLMTFGFTLPQALSVIVVGNLSYLLLGVCSLQGPQTGTTTFAINRAPFGTHGSRGLAFFNWLTQIGFEVEGLILIVGAALALGIKAGLAPGDPAKIVIIVAAVAVQGVLPFLGHATIVKTLRVLVAPFVVVFVVLLALSVPHVALHTKGPGADWQVYLEGLAFTITLAGLGWAEDGNDYTRYCSPDASRRAIVGWVFLGTAVPQIILMVLGALVGTFLTTVGTSANAFLPFVHQSFYPGWFVVVFLVLGMAQLFAVGSLDMYSSGVTLQAVGLRVKRYQTVLIDCAVALVVTTYAVFNSSFNGFLKDFVDLVIVWIAPWVAIFLVDWALRRLRYAPGELVRTDRGGLYFRRHGLHWPAVAAQLAGMYAAISSLAATFALPRWLNVLTDVTRDARGQGADVSVFAGMVVAGTVYLLAAWRSVRRQAGAEDRLGVEVLGPAPSRAP